MQIKSPKHGNKEPKTEMKPDYEIIDLTDLTAEEFPTFYGCLTPEEPTIKEAGNIKAEWYQKRYNLGFGAKLARSSDGTLLGMIQYVPIEESSAEGEDLYFVFCIWIPPKKRNAGGQQRKKGIGKALLKAAEEQVRKNGAGGLVVWGTVLPFFMKSSWFKRQGYKTAEKAGITELLWKSFKPGITPPKWRTPVPPSQPQPQPNDNTKKNVTVTRFINGICPAMNLVHQRFKQAAEEIGEPVVLTTVETWDPNILQKWGQTDAIYINDREFSMGPPPSYKKIKQTLLKEVKKL